MPELEVQEAPDAVAAFGAARGVIAEQGPPETMLDSPREEATRRFLRRFLEA